MSHPIAVIQIERFKRQAKKLSRELGILHSQALNRIAQTHGFANWSLLAKHAEKPPFVSLVHGPSVKGHPSTSRYYLHGDQDEQNSALYYCASCDFFVDAGHFEDTNAHAVEGHAERFLGAFDRWNTAEAEAFGWHRAEHAVNLLEKSAVLGRLAYEKSRSPFHRWLLEQVGRHDAVGRLAEDARGDKNFPVAAKTMRPIASYLHPYGSHNVDALKDAWNEFLESKRSV